MEESLAKTSLKGSKGMRFYSKKNTLFSSLVFLGISMLGFAQTTPEKFHDTKGNIEVTKSGQLQYTLNIDVPPGIKDVSPSISLVYTSGGQNGLAGYNWNISGLSSISRVGRYLEKDGITKGVQLDYSDYYSFNGQRLILKSGEYGKDGAEYVTEKYSNIKIKSVGAISGQIWKGPEYWEVTFGDGSQAWYGATAPGNSSARSPIDYNIVKSRDINGNYITYTYTTDQNVSVISNIQWGGNENQGTPHLNKIEFVFGTRPLAETAYIRGVGFAQSKLLASIIVSGNNKQYKKYSVTYKNDLQQTSYRYLDKITVANGKNEEANPVTFTYEKSMNAPNPNVPTWGFPTVVNHNYATDLFGDFDGDGRLDLIKYHASTSTTISQVGMYFYRNFYHETGEDYPPIYIGNSINGTELKNSTAVNVKKNNLVNSRQGFVTYTTITNTSTSKKDLRLSFYSISNDNNLVLDFTKTIPDFERYNLVDNPDDLEPIGGKLVTILGLKNLDFNGDGLSELVLQLNFRYCSGGGTDPFTPSSNDANLLPPGTTCENFKRHIVIETDDSTQGNGWYYGIELYNENNEDPFKNYKSGDFNGDGVFDFLKLNPYKIPQLISFEKNSEGKYISFISPLTQNNTVFKGMWQDGLAGDYNGDGLSDIMIPNSNDSALWYLYTSTGVDFKEETRNFLSQHRNRTITNSSNNDISVANPRTFIAFDINNDGKAELIALQSSRYYQKEYNQDNPGAGVKYRVTSGSGVSILATCGGNPDFDPLYSDYTWGQVVYLNSGNIDSALSVWTGDMVGIPVDHLAGAMLKKFALISAVPSYEGTLYMATHKYYDISMEGRIKSISQGGITTNITYKQLDKSQNPGLYDTSVAQSYPYVEVSQAAGMYVVSQLVQNFTADKKLKQDFRYRGLTSNILGRGMIGFRKTARSSWYADGMENTKIWSGMEIDPVNEGVPVKEWSIRTNIESNIFPADVSENNTQLLSFKATSYQIDKLLNGQVVTNVADADKPKVVLVIVPKTTKGKDFLTGATAESTVTYGEYYLPTQSVSKINNNYAITTSTYTYYNNPSGIGNNYYFGRPKSKSEVVQAYSNTTSAKEEYTYESNRIKTIKKWNADNTAFILDTYSYDGFGNVTQNVASNSIDSQTETTGSLYDASGRFVIKKVDNLGLETQIGYNDCGQVTNHTDPLGNTLNNTYDDWGKLLTSTTNLDGTTTYSYERDSNSNVIVTQNDSDGDVSKSFTNKLGQKYKVSTKAFGQGKFVSQEIQYDILGRKIKESEPYFEGQSANQWNVITYDDTVYPAKTTATAFTGKQTETSVSGFTTTVKEMNGYGRINTKTVDALGNVVSTTDKGGTIQFKYNPAGQQIEAKYGENTVTTKYDLWGRKSEFNDPSNGVYTYEYNGLGQPAKTISPKGSKTYTYNNVGQLIAQKEFSTIDGGETTDKTISFAYNNKGMLIGKSGTANGQAFNFIYTYDPKGRLLSSVENSYGKTYTQNGITYDDFGRISAYDKEVASSGVVTQVNIQNVYSPWNGELYQIKERKSGKILWELKETNAKGQVLQAKLGAVEVNNTYDPNGFLAYVNQSSAVKPNLLRLSYVFDALRNELKSRKTEGDFDIEETFFYDDNNRLIKWTHPVTGLYSQNTYDVKGRIMENDQVGTMNFESSSKIYQPTGMTLNSNGVENYNNDLIQSIVFNENNDPVQINGEKAGIRFAYGLGSMRQRVDISMPSQNGTPGDLISRKFYNEDGSFEIVGDATTNQEKHILYIGGSPYESDIVYLKDFDQTEGSFKFLHKDYIGSILAISDEAGNKLEQRHFDAWGNFTHFQVGGGSIITEKSAIEEAPLVIDRGYTSHEHFMEVGIIHMNGRLYDPLLRRFLNADENIQDPTNTQNYNKYGYVMNNPLMYSDPNGEFWWWAAGAIAGGYLSGVQANGSWNPGKWNWEKTWSAVLGGAIGGAAISGALGNIAGNSGAIKTTLPGLVSGGLSAAFNGSSFFVGALNSVSSSEGLFYNRVTSTEIDSNSNTAYKNYNEPTDLYDILFYDLIFRGDDQASIFREQLSKNYQLDGTPDFSQNNIAKMISSVDELTRLYNLSGRIAVFKPVSFIPGGRTDVPSATLGETLGSMVYLSKSAIRNNLDLGLTLGHEMIHVYHNLKFRRLWMETYRDTSGKRASAISEMEAHTWSKMMGDRSANSNLSHYSHKLRIFGIIYVPKNIF
jgi:RHS repeat-associated protein